jgi:hypothetical protein
MNRFVRIAAMVGALGATSLITVLAVMWFGGHGTLPAVSAPLPAGSLVVEEIRLDPVQILLPTEPTVFHQFVDEQGIVLFVESRDAVPEEWRAKAGRVVLSALPPTSPAAARMIRKLQATDESGG